MKQGRVLEINGSLLHAVPAVHYRAVFAREVNFLCSNEKTCPEAIAVELGPHMVREIISFLKDLGVSPAGEVILPCMLGILVKNRLMHPEFRDAAHNLQAYYRKPLNGISAVLQKQLLHFSDKNIVGLSSTDSIIEAIRCAIQLDIPVYGVDLDEYSSKPDTCPLVEEPSTSGFDLWKYVAQNEKAAAQVRDPYVDGRRELVMAARLKTILGKHKRVLFTGGLAHWEEIIKLLSSSAVRPADILVPEAQMNFTRVIVHPNIAVAFMDFYPVLTTLYEETRHNPVIKNNFPFTLSDTGHVFQDILSKTYKKHFIESTSNLSEGNGCLESQKLPDFERLLSIMRMLHQHDSPLMADLLNCASSMMTLDFCTVLTSQLMDLGRAWASPKQFPGLPLISSVPYEKEELNTLVHIDTFQLIETEVNETDQEVFCDKRSSSFSVRINQENRIPQNFIRLWQWEDEPKEPHGPFYYNDWIWPPCEALLFGSAYEASRIAATRSREPVAAPFEGSLYDGFDAKASIRSVIIGERKIYIKKPLSSRKSFSPDGKRPEPTVFIFEDDHTDIKSTWSLLMGGSNLGNHIKNKQRYEEIVKKSGNCFISSISMVHNHPVPVNLKPHIDSISILDGIIAFGSPCMNAKQGAEWVEDNDYQACPALNYSSIDNLVKYYQKQHNLEISISDWETALIQFAIPYAKERVVLIVPGNYKVPGMIQSEARKRNISIDLVPLNYFPPDRVVEMRKRILVRAMDCDGFNFSPEIEKALGQKSDKYFELLPPYMQHQLGKI